MESLWVAKTGLEAQQTRLSVISQNLANINTTGYKRGRAIFHRQWVFDFGRKAMAD